jgi:hypothetical protein
VGALDKIAGSASWLRKASSLVGFAGLLVLSGPVGAAAQTAAAEDRPVLEAQKEALFQQMFREPANLDVTLCLCRRRGPVRGLRSRGLSARADAVVQPQFAAGSTRDRCALL